MGQVAIEAGSYTHLKIAFRGGAEVWCPYEADEVDIIGARGCLPEHKIGGCRFLSSVKPGEIICKWTEADGRAEES